MTIPAAALPFVSADMVEISERQWEPKMVRHYNRHDAFSSGSLATRVFITRHGSLNGPIFQVEMDGQTWRSGRIYPLPR